MGPPRRSHPQTTAIPSDTPARTPSEHSMTDAQSPPGNLGMSPASRYTHNLKVLRRRDPSIVSIFDQFSHVCIYHHDGEKWLKHGYEGSMFLFERNSYPPYGLYILNRVGMEDYVQGIYPEDDIVQNGKFLIIRSYPEFLAKRLANLPARETLDKFSPLYAIPNIEALPKDQKGRFVAKGLWMLATDSRDSMMEVMLRLHSYVKQNIPYPEEFRYGPGRPPPPHRLKAVRKPAGSQSDSQITSQSDSEAYQSDAMSASSGELSAVEKLFLKLAPSPASSAATATARQPAQSANISLEGLFASVQGPITAGPVPPSPSTASSTGISLLDSIFASAALPPPQPQISTSIYSPQPTTSAPPQVLTQDVLSNLLGLPPTRTASAASSISISAVSHPSSREGDNEDDGGSDSPNTMFDLEGDFNTGPSVARSDLLSTLGLAGSRLTSQGKINGDVTPRAPLNGLQRSTFPSAIELTTSTTTVRSSASTINAQPAAPEANGKPRPNRALVPFEPDSELWPYSRGPVEENSPTDGNDDGEIVELNFEDTSVLSDPDAFDKALKNKRSAVHLRGNHLNGNDAVHTNGSPDNRGTKKKGKKSKKERDARAREEIEKSWDVPPSPSSTNETGSEHIDMLFGPPASPSPCPSPELYLPVPEMKTPTMTARATLAHVNGHLNGVVSPYKAKAKAINGVAKMSVNGHVNNIDVETVHESIIAVMEAQPRPVAKMEKADFMKEVLTLIHTDKAFVDTLWREYMGRLA